MHCSTGVQVVTEVLKVVLGRLRPDFQDRCFKVAAPEVLSGVETGSSLACVGGKAIHYRGCTVPAQQVRLCLRDQGCE